MNESDLADAPAQLSESIKLYKATAQDVVEGSFHRLKNTFLLIIEIVLVGKTKM